MINIRELLKLLETFHYRTIFGHSKIGIKEWIGYCLWVSDLVIFFFFNEWEIEFLPFIQQFCKLFFFSNECEPEFYIRLCCMHKLFWFQLLGLKREEREHGRERERWNAGQQINNGFLLFGENNSLARAGEVPFMT